MRCEADGRGLYEILKNMSSNLKPSEAIVPELSITERGAEDECLIMASDGIWNVIPEDMACAVASRCLGDQTLDVPPPPSNNKDYLYYSAGTGTNSTSTGLISSLDNYRLQAAETSDLLREGKFPYKSGHCAVSPSTWSGKHC